jgi:amphi-Trp domain-containing protein
VRGAWGRVLRVRRGCWQSSFREEGVVKKARDVEKVYTAKQFVSKLRRLADAIENDRRFQIQVAGERVSIPSDATISVEHERDGDTEEVEFQIRWSNG